MCVAGVEFEYLNIRISASIAYISNHKLTPCFLSQLLTYPSILNDSLVPLVSPWNTLPRNSL